MIFEVQFKECCFLVKNKPTKKERAAGIDFPAMKGIKEEMQKRPELEKKLRKDFEGTLKAEGIVVNDVFKNRMMREWREGIMADLRRKVVETPGSRNWYLKRVVEGKPIMIHVKVDRKTGKITKKLEDEV